MKAVFLDSGSLGRDDLDLSSLQATVSALVRYETTASNEIITRLSDADIAITNKVGIDREVVEACPRLKLVCVVATGTNNVDLAAASDHGVRVVNCRDYATASVSQHVLALILALVRQVPNYRDDVRAGHWHASPFFCRLDYDIHELENLRLGIVGYGNLGAATANLAVAVGMEVMIAERPRAAKTREGRVPFDECLRGSDIISLHCPLTDDTHRLIGQRELDLIGPGSYLINTARGGLVDEDALARALADGRLAGAGIDVVSEEPPRGSNPLLDASLNNLIVTPHCAWGSRTARQRVVEQTAANIRAFREGDPLRLVV